MSRASETNRKKIVKKRPSHRVTKKAAKKKTGRPTLYSEKLTDKICEEIAAGKSLVAICKQKGMPGYTAVMGWLRKYDEFRERYARAREDQAHTLADEIIEISDEPVKDAVGVARARNRMDSRKWMAAKLLPKKYGERTAHEIGGPEGGPIPLAQIQITAEMTPEAASKAYDAFLAAGARLPKS